jgi:dolichol kinase
MSAMWTEIKRKLFHLLGLIYVAGIIYLPRRPYLALLALALIAVLMVERARLSRPAMEAWIERRFGGLLRARETRRFSGVPWMMGGVLIATALLGPVAPAAAAVLYLLLGDAAASLVGIRLGGPRWPGSPKSIAGSLACFVVCLVVGRALLAPDYGWTSAVAGAIAATALEFGPLPIDDNLAIPAGASVVLLITCRLMPFGGLWQ